MSTVWLFATEGQIPDKWPHTECPPWRKGMSNEELDKALTICRTGLWLAEGRIRLWERWLEIERDAHTKGSTP